MSKNNFIKKKKFPVYIYVTVFILTAFAFPIYLSSNNSFYIAFSIALSGGGCAWLFFNSGYILGTASWLSSLLVCALINKSPIPAGITVLILLCGIFFSMVSKRRMSRSLAIGILTSISSVAVIVLFLINLYTSANEISISAIKNVYSSIFSPLKELLKNSFSVTIAGNSIPIITDVNADEYINFFICIFSGLCIMAISFLCYFTGFVYQLLLSLTKSEKPEASDWKLLPKPITAAFFCISLLFSFVSESIPVIWLSSINIILIFLPGFFFSGLESIPRVTVVNGVAKPKIFRGVIFFFALLSGLPTVIIVPAIFGVIDSIKAAFPKNKQKTNL